MKPTLQPKNLTRNTHKTASTFPLTDANYSVTMLPNFNGACARREVSSFRDISSDYFRNEARGEFRREGVAFAAIVLAAAIPLLNNMHALADFLRAIRTL